MKMGTKSVLFGAHCFFLHPWFVAWGWWKLYGFPWDPRLWVAFFVHDLGYIGKADMDGEEQGETHPNFGADLMNLIFDSPDSLDWYYFCLLHSRFYSKKLHLRPSKLCYADKMAIVLTPWWLYLPLVTMTGEIDEYMAMHAANNKGAQLVSIPREWYRDMQEYVSKWIEEHKDGREDTWTSADRRTVSM